MSNPSSSAAEAGRTPAVSRWFLGVVLLLVPALLTFWWGRDLPPGAYRLLHSAQQLRAGSVQALGSAWGLQNPLYVLVLALFPGRADIFALALSALGWSAVAGVLYALLARAWSRPSAVMAALLVACSPAVALSAGRPDAWVLALGWGVLALTVLPPRHDRGLSALKLVLLLLMLTLHFDAAALLFATAVLLADGLAGRSSWAPLLALLGAVFGGLALALWLGDWPGFAWTRPGWWSRLPTLARDWQLWWLFLPGAILGLHALSSRKPSLLRVPLGLAALWLGTALLSGSALAGPLAAVWIALLNGLGLWSGISVLQQGGRLSTAHTTSVAALLLFPLLAGSLLMARQGATVDRRALGAAQEEAAAWLRAAAAPEATLLAPPRVAYAAGRPALPQQLESLPAGDSGPLFTAVLAAPPEFVVSQQTTAWDTVTRSGWFRERYAPVHEVRRDYSSATPLIIWQYQPTPLDRVTSQPLQARVAEMFDVVGYQFAPQIFAPGEEIYLALALRANEKMANGFITGVHLIDPDGRIWAWREEQTPRSLSGTWWAPGQVIVERFIIPTTADLPDGAYSVEAFWRAADNDDRQLPVLQGTDENVLDRVKLGYAIVPPAPPAAETFAVDARFGEQIMLSEAALGTAVPGETLDVTLVWEALAAVEDDYTVFVHVLDQSGALVASSDSKPAAGRMPTVAWVPGLAVTDGHELLLPPDLPPGGYRINIGLYELASGQRLPVVDGSGTAVPDGSLPLVEFTIGGG